MKLMRKQILEIVKKQPLTTMLGYTIFDPEQFAIELESLQDSKPQMSAEEILKDNLNESLWTFICTYPVTYKADEMLKDWIIEAMHEFAGQPKVSDENIWNAAKEYATEHGRAFYSEYFQAYKDGATEMRDNKIYISPDNKIKSKKKP